MLVQQLVQQFLILIIFVAYVFAQYDMRCTDSSSRTYKICKQFHFRSCRDNLENVWCMNLNKAQSQHFQIECPNNLILIYLILNLYI